MKPENISDAIGMLDEDLIAEADAARKGRLSDRSKRRRPFWVAGAAAAVCLCLLAFASLLAVGATTLLRPYVER